MADYIRRLVSGNKARFKDEELRLELDLVYVTDQIIIMGYPASGFESYYRNRREDVKKFLDHRHGKNYWVFNFCPLKENSYDADVFEGRVSRYPFPDHHAPPLAIMPLVARDMREWLGGSPERVAVLHCKAGKGRSGTMACSYLLSLDEDPAPPKLQRSLTTKEWAKKRVENTVDALPGDQELDKMVETKSPLLKSPSPLKVHPTDEVAQDNTTHTASKGETGSLPNGAPSGPTLPSNATRRRSFTGALKSVLDLHTSRRMRASSDPQKKIKQGVSIPSQRRYLNYWALLLAHQAPRGFWSLNPSPPPSISLSASRPASPASSISVPKQRVRLTEIKLRLRELSSVKLGLAKAANMIMDKTAGSGSGSLSVPKPQSPVDKNGETVGANHIWASLARYDDNFITMLEKWEKHTRDEGGRIGVRRSGSERMVVEGGKEDALSGFFSDGKWDKDKMVRSFAQLGEIAGSTPAVAQDCDKNEKTLTYTLRPLSGKRWEGLKKDIEDETEARTEEINVEELDLPSDEAFSMYDTRPNSPLDKGAKLPSHEPGVVLDAEREVRIKLYMGQVFMGWLWLIPTFHMSQPPPTNNSSTPAKTTIRLTRKEIDFPIGLGSGIVDVEISFEWITSAEVRRQAESLLEAGLSGGKDAIRDVLVDPPALALNGDSMEEPTGGAAVVTAVLAGMNGSKHSEALEDGPMQRMLEVKQGTED